MLTERTTRFTLLFELPEDRGPATVTAALMKVVKKLPKHLIRSLTWDEGKKLTCHARASRLTLGSRSISVTPQARDG